LLDGQPWQDAADHLGDGDHHRRYAILGVDGGPGQHHRRVVVGVFDAVGEDDAAAHAVAQHHTLDSRVLACGNADQGVEVTGVVGEVLQVDALTARATVPAQVERVGDQARRAEALGDVVVATSVLAEPVAQHHDASRRGLRGPDVVDDADGAATALGTLEAAFLAGS
jgi:hypothetical protein